MGIITKVIGDNPTISLSIDSLRVGSKLPFDVYIKDKGILKQVFNKNTIFTNVAKDILKSKGTTVVYVHKTDELALLSYNENKEQKKVSILDDPIQFKNYSFTKEEHHQIDKYLLIPGSNVTFSIFLMSKLKFSQLVEASEQNNIKIPDLRLVDGDLVIKKSDLTLYNQYINEIINSKDIPENEKSKINSIAIRENSKVIMKSILDDPRSGKNIAKTAEVVNNMIDNILENKDSIYDMLSLRNFDYYTYTHSVNVSVLSIGLGIELGLKRNEIEKLGTGAMLHDIGKSTIPHEVLNKQGKLNDVEYRIIMNHVIDGYNLVKDRKDLDKDSIIPLLQHHEKLNGKGYPNKLIAKEIKLFGRITSIADCYDALTTQRPYKPAFTPYYALSIIAKETGNYDPELLRIFIKMLGNIK